jgi:integrase/recombinase XerD
MAVRRLGEKTKSNYIYHVESFTAFLGRSPDTATAEDVRRLQVHLTEMTLATGCSRHSSP